MRILIVAVGKLKAPFLDDIAHYEKLISRYARLELVEVTEDAQVQKRVPDRAFVSLLTEGGEMYDSVRFSSWIEGRRQSGLDLCFVIQGPFGGLELDRVDHRLSLGPQTMPHQLARVVLLEQLYRGHKIIAGETYHY